MRIWNFPTVPVAKQLFHVPGQAMEGGFTSGGVRMLSPEPGGRAVLELELALRNDWDFPIGSWLMSKGNGEVFRVRLAPTPQVLSARSAPVPWDNGALWSNHSPWAGDITASYAASALEGTDLVSVNMSGWGDIIRPGHVIGVGDNTHLVDDVIYNSDTNIANLQIKTPLRRDLASGENAYFRPWFTGTISNLGEIRATYDASLNGFIQVGKIIFAEAVV